MSQNWCLKCNKEISVINTGALAGNNDEKLSNDLKNARNDFLNACKKYKKNESPEERIPIMKLAVLYRKAFDAYMGNNQFKKAIKGAKNIMGLREHLLHDSESIVLTNASVKFDEKNSKERLHFDATFSDFVKKILTLENDKLDSSRIEVIKEFLKQCAEKVMKL